MTLTEHDLNALMRAEHADPFRVLGMHTQQGQLSVTALLPSVDSVDLVDKITGQTRAKLERIEGTDLFTATIGQKIPPFSYEFLVTWSIGPANPQLVEDPYRFPLVLQDMDLWLLAEGTHQRPFECLGAHLKTVDGVAGTTFAVWAPNARRVSVVGSFNSWDGRRHPMRLRKECGVWEIFIPAVGQGDLYKFEILGAKGVMATKADPFAFHAQLRPDTASVVYPLPARLPMRADRAAANAFGKPISIYEVHLGSWRKADGWRWLSYRELAETLVPYAKE
ncbi:MAG: GlgB N-terminal domain-containing protein, partial [Rhodoferax sp.]